MKNLLSGSLSMILVSCGPGVADFSEDIGSTGYRFHRTSSESMWVGPGKECAGRCAGISDKVLNYLFNEKVIVAMRQVVNHYTCVEGFNTSEVTYNIVYHYISLEDDESHGPYSEKDFAKIVASSKSKFVGISIEKLKSNKQALSMATALRKGCTNPYKIS